MNRELQPRPLVVLGLNVWMGTAAGADELVEITYREFRPGLVWPTSWVEVTDQFLSSATHKTGGTWKRERCCHKGNPPPTGEQRPDSPDSDDGYGDKHLDLDMHVSRRLVHQPTNHSLGSHVVKPQTTLLNLIRFNVV